MPFALVGPTICSVVDSGADRLVVRAIFGADKG